MSEFGEPWEVFRKPVKEGEYDQFDAEHVGIKRMGGNVFADYQWTWKQHADCEHRLLDRAALCVNALAGLSEEQIPEVVKRGKDYLEASDDIGEVPAIGVYIGSDPDGRKLAVHGLIRDIRARLAFMDENREVVKYLNLMAKAVMAAVEKKGIA